nr:uncharacterized protein LOC107372644 [Nothobranchius furzeri]
MEHPNFKKAQNGTLILRASDAAKAVGPQRQGYRAKQPEEVEADARAHVAREGGDVNNATLVLSRWKVQFGTYQGKTFHWLLQNDVGYAVMLVASHQKERERTGSQSPLMANKDAFTRYSLAYPEFAEAVRFRQAFEEARVKSLQPGQEGQALVGFGDFKFESLQSLYDSKDPKTIRFVNYLRRATPAPGSQMENAVCYVKKRDRQREGATAASAAATSTTSTPVAASTSSSSRVSVCPSYQRPKAASQFAAFVSGRRSLSAVEMQAKLKKMVAPKPAFPPSSRPARPPTASGEPSDEELVQAVVDQGQPSGVQAPLPLPPPSPSPPPPVAAKNPSAGREEPTDEELLEAAQETPALPAAVLPPPPPAASSKLLPESWQAALTAEQQEWIGRVLFTRDRAGRPRLITELSPWWYPPQPRAVYTQPPASPDPFFACRLFLWMPHRMWHLQLTCPQPLCSGILIKAGLYRTIRRVLDIDGWYLMATEYLECRRCKKKVGGWSQGIVRQLPPTYSCQFPAVLTYKLSCDQRVVAMLRSRTLGNSATQLCNTLREQHSDAWMRRAIQYIGVCEQFLALGTTRGQIALPPQMPPVPSPVWLLTVYGYDVLTRLDEYKARITSTFGSILKMDSTKKVTKKLAGAASGTAAWSTNVGNEHGQVLMSVLTCCEGSEGLSKMAAGLMRRYRLAEVPAPQLIYVDRDCCKQDGVSKTAALFPEWERLIVRLDIWHLMRRFASGVTTESHELYPTFMRQLSYCIFEVDAEDARRLVGAKRSELEGTHGMVNLTDADVIQRISKEEWRLHCRRRTRGAEESTLLIQNLLDTFRGPAGHNTLNIPLLNALRIQDIWDTQRRHLSCIQDPPGVQLYTQTGSLQKGGVTLPVYRCARGSTSLESFHLHLNRFIPGTSASAKYFQAFLIDGLVRWNEDRAAAAERHKAPLLSYSGHLRHALNQKSQKVFGLQMVKDFTKPAAYTGELIGVEYLFQQTGRVLEDVSMDPDAPDEAAAVTGLDEVDEGIQEDVGDFVAAFVLDVPSTSTSGAARSGDPAVAPGSEPAHPAAPPEVPGSQAPEGNHSSDSEEEIQGPDGQPGYQHVLKLAQALVELRSLQGLSDSRVDRLIALWQRLPERDKQRIVYPSRYRERQPKGRFKAAKGKDTSCPGVVSLQRCLGGEPSGAANWPDASRVVEAMCSQLCHLYPAASRVNGVSRSRWFLICNDYMAVRQVVLNCPRLMAQTQLQLYELNQKTISQWFSYRQKRWEKGVLEQGTGAVSAPTFSHQPIPSAKGLSSVQVGRGQPFNYNIPEEQQPGPSSRGLPPSPLPPPAPHPGPSTSCNLPPPSAQSLHVIHLFMGSTPLSPPVLTVPRTTAFRRRKAAEAAAAAGVQAPPSKTARQQFTCSKCGQPKRLDTGHTRIAGVSYCATVGGKSVEEWKKEMKTKTGGGPEKQ